MESSTPKAFAYILVLLAFFSILFVMHSVFGIEGRQFEPPLGETYQSDESTTVELASEGMEDDDIIEKISQTTEETQEKVAEEITTPENNGSDAPQSYFESLLERYKTNTLEALENGKARTDIIIRYYRHAPDGNSAYALEELGYYIHERPVDQRFANFQSNAIYYGDSVSIEDIRLVGYTLLKEGLPIKEIKPSKFSDSWKSKSIEIGADTTIIDQPSLDLEALQAFEK